MDVPAARRGAACGRHSSPSSPSGSTARSIATLAREIPTIRSAGIHVADAPVTPSNTPFSLTIKSPPPPRPHHEPHEQHEQRRRTGNRDPPFHARYLPSVVLRGAPVNLLVTTG